MWISVTINNKTTHRCVAPPAATATNEHIVNAIETPVAKGTRYLRSDLNLRHMRYWKDIGPMFQASNTGNTK